MEIRTCSKTLQERQIPTAISGKPGVRLSHNQCVEQISGSAVFRLFHQDNAVETLGGIGDVAKELQGGVGEFIGTQGTPGFFV